MRSLFVISALLGGFTFWILASPSQEEAKYVGQEQCSSCHPTITENFEQVGMARTFQPIGDALPIEDWNENNSYYHQPSNQHFLMTSREGRFFQKRYQLDKGGDEINALEVEIQFALGSGLKERDYAAHLPGGELVQMPVVWYSDEGIWSIAPGYDLANHDGFRRRINYRCIFCHASYPDLADNQGKYEVQTALFEEGVSSGIDCERCHGPGSLHVKHAMSGLGSGAVRDSIVNPARLDRNRQMDVCLQCHLETTSAPLPNSTLKLSRSVFSFRPGETLKDYAVYFDFPEGVGHDDDFNIVHQGYQLTRSACFKNSNMTCLSCHDPHRIPDEPESFFRGKCLECHDNESCALEAGSRQANGDNCVSCHMPQRRTDDIVHVVMTDHYIRRSVPEDLLSPIEEKDNRGYRGNLKFYLPEENEKLYMGMGLARGPDLVQGVEMLETAIKSDEPKTAEPYFYLASAYEKLERSNQAIKYYRKVLEIDPIYAEAYYNLGLIYLGNKQLETALQLFQESIRLQPRRGDSHIVIGVALTQLDRLEEARRAYFKALELDPLNVLALNNLGLLALQTENKALAIGYFKRVLRVEPSDSNAREMLKRLE